MITLRDLSHYFDLEAQAATQRWQTTMALPLAERIRKRKAIGHVYLDPSYQVASDEGNLLLQLKVAGTNLSDFKEGEHLVLHQGDPTSGIKCTLWRYQGDDATIIIEVFPRNMPHLDSWCDVPLVLDSDLVDMREYIYRPFVNSLTPTHQAFSWLRCQPKPHFVAVDSLAVEVKRMAQQLALDLLPSQREAIVRALAAQDYYLVQGPPGTGKTLVLALIMLAEMTYWEHKVVVIGPNHHAINNALVQVLKLASTLVGASGACDIHQWAAMAKVGQSYYAPRQVVTYQGEDYGISNITRLNVSRANQAEQPWLMGMTPHSLYTSRAKGLMCDTLIIDEAGQMTIPLALMGMVKARKVILAGDHKQLPPIVASDQIKGTLRQSVFQALMTTDNCTMLDVSWRMCEPICGLVSALFYDGKLQSMRTGIGGKWFIGQETLYDFDTPIVIHHIDDDGLQTSDSEAAWVSQVVGQYIDKGLPASEVAVLTPFRAQAANIRRHLRQHPLITAEQRALITIDTIDKMQGQEREVIIVSMAAGNRDYVTEMADFLYNPNKLNVAFSRAKSKLIIVGNIEQIKHLDPAKYPHLHQLITSPLVTHL